MVDEKVLREPSAKFVYEVQCMDVHCRHVFTLVSLRRGITCPVCGYHDPNHKTYRRLVCVKE